MVLIEAAINKYEYGTILGWYFNEKMLNQMNYCKLYYSMQQISINMPRFNKDLGHKIVFHSKQWQNYG